MKPLRILIIGINYAPEPTGIGKYTGEMGAYWANKGHKVEVVTAFPYYPHWKIDKQWKPFWWQKSIVEGAHIVRCPLYVPAQPSGLLRMLQDISFFCSSWVAVTGKMIRGNKFDLVFVASPSLLSGFVGLWYILFFKQTKMVYHIQDLQVDAAAEFGLIKQRWLLNLLFRVERFILSNTAVVSTISDAMAKKIAAKGVKIQRLLLLPNWTDATHIFPLTVQTNVLEALHLPANKKIFFYSGAMGEKQGLEIILAAAALIAPKHPDVLFVLAGAGPYKQKLQQLATGQHNIQLIDLQPISIFNELLNLAFAHLIIQKESAADLLLPSKLTNILCIGGRLIVTALPGTTLHDVIMANKMGMVVPPENPSELADAVTTLLTSPELAYFRNNATKYAANHLQMDALIDRFVHEIFG